jgi:hypothetical protein
MKRQNSLGPRQRILLGTMLFHGGAWPHDQRMSEREYKAANLLARRGWIERCGNTFKISQGMKTRARRLLGQ